MVNSFRLSAHVLITVYYVTSLTYGARRADGVMCLLKPLNSSESQSLCNVVLERLNNTTTGKGIARLENCKKSYNSVPGIPFCSYYINSTTCFLSIELSHFVEHESLKWARNHSFCDTGDLYKTTLKITSVSVNRVISLVGNIKELTFNQLLLEDINLNINLDKFLSSNFDEMLKSKPSRRLTEIVMRKTKSDLGITAGTFDRDKYPFLKSVIIEDSTIVNFSEGAFQMGKEFQTVALRNLVPKDGLFARGAIKLSCTTDRKQTHNFGIMIDGSGLTPGTLGNDFISIGPDGCNDGGLRLDLRVTGNLLDHSLPQEIFGGLVGEFQKGRDRRMNLTYDKIACCLSENRWIFAKNLTESKNITLFTGCSDIDDDIYKYRNEAELDQSCEAHNSKPILIIAIFSSLLLFILLGGLSILCIYYVIPKKGAIIVINSKLKSPSTAQAETTSTETDITQATKHPLMSTGPKEDNTTTRSALKSTSINSLPITSSNAKSSSPKSLPLRRSNRRLPSLTPSPKSAKASAKTQPEAPVLRGNVLRSNRQQGRPHKQ